MTKKQINFSKFTSIKIGKKVDVFIIQNNLNPLPEAYLIGGCNNILLSDNPPPLMMLGKQYDYIKVEDNTLKIGAATPSGKIVSFCKKNNIANFEFLSHLPGTMGGIVKMNAGLKEYEIFNNLLYINLYDEVKQKDEIDFRYRYTNINSIILEATFKLDYGFDQEKIELFKKMRQNQPKFPSAGSCFKNPENDYAGRLIEAVGLKGKRVGGAEFSLQHANFLVNVNNASYNDAITLINEAKEKVYNKFKINLECEIIIL